METGKVSFCSRQRPGGRTKAESAEVLRDQAGRLNMPWYLRLSSNTILSILRTAPLIMSGGTGSL
jgi:hypothetical protein